jgi:hypothetical protein
MVRQQFLDHVRYNVELTPDFWNIDTVVKKIKK